MELKDNVVSVLEEGRNEVSHATLLQKASLGATACALVFEWGTGNEALIGMVGGNVFRHTHDVLLTAAATGAASFGEQTLFGLTAAIAIANFPRVTRAVRTKFFGEIQEQKAETKGITAGLDTLDGQSDSEHNKRQNEVATLAGRFVTAFTLGTAVPTIVKSATRERSLSENAKDVLKDAALIGLGVVAIAGAASAATNAGDAVGMQQQSEVFVNVITNPGTYVGLFGLKTAWSIVKQRFNKHKGINSMSPHEEANVPSQKELFRSSDGVLRVVVSEGVGQEERESIWEMVRDGFNTLNSHSAERQDPTRAELEEDMDSTEVLKYIAYDGSDKPVGFMTAHIGLDSVTWVDESMKSKMAERQSELDPSASPVYVGTLVVPEALRATEVAPALLRGALLHWKDEMTTTDERFLCFFDCAQANYPGLPLLIKRLARPSDTYEGVPIDIQEVGEVKIEAPVDDTSVEESARVASDTIDQKIVDIQHYFSIEVQ